MNKLKSFKPIVIVTGVLCLLIALFNLFATAFNAEGVSSTYIITMLAFSGLEIVGTISVIVFGAILKDRNKKINRGIIHAR